MNRSGVYDRRDYDKAFWQFDPTNEGGTAYEFTPLLTWYVRGGFFVWILPGNLWSSSDMDSKTDLWRALRRDS